MTEQTCSNAQRVSGHQLLSGACARMVSRQRFSSTQSTKATIGGRQRHTELSAPRAFSVRKICARLREQHQLSQADDRTLPIAYESDWPARLACGPARPACSPSHRADAAASRRRILRGGFAVIDRPTEQEQLVSPEAAIRPGLSSRRSVPLRHQYRRPVRRSDGAAHGGHAGAAAPRTIKDSPRRQGHSDSFTDGRPGAKAHRQNRARVHDDDHRRPARAEHSVAPRRSCTRTAARTRCVSSSSRSCSIDI